MEELLTLEDGTHPPPMFHACSLEVVDFRVHGGHHSGDNDVMFEMYLKDAIVLAPLTKHQAELGHDKCNLDEKEAMEAALALDEMHGTGYRDVSVTPSLGAHPTGKSSTEIDNSEADAQEIESMEKMWAAEKAHIASAHEVKLRIQELQAAFVVEVAHDPRVAELGGVVIKRWEPPLDEEHPENDDEMAIRFAEHVMHRIQFDKVSPVHSNSTSPSSTSTLVASSAATVLLLLTRSRWSGASPCLTSHGPSF